MTIGALTPSPKQAAVLIGLAVPFLAFGRTIMALPLLLAVLILVRLPGRRGYWRALLEQTRTPIGVMVIITLALWLPSMLFSPLPLRSLEAWSRVPIFIGLVTIFWAMLSEDRAWLFLALKTLLIASAVTAVLALFSILVLPEALSFVRLRGWVFIRPDHFLKEYASMAILLGPVLLWAGWRMGGRWLILAVITMIGLLAIIWLTYNRSAMAGLFAMLVVGGGLTMASRRNLTVNVAIAVVLVAIALALGLWLYDTRGYMQAPEGAVAVLPPWLLDYQRQTIWANAFDIGMRSPWFGNGINVINLLPGADAPIPTDPNLRVIPTDPGLHVIPAHPHNWLVEVFAETGAIGAISLLTLVIALGLKLAGDYLKYRDWAFLAALLVNVGYWGSGLLNFSFWSAWWQISYLLMTAFCLAGRERPAEF